MLGAYYPTKKALKEAIGKRLKYIETSVLGEEYKDNGTLYVVGPSPHNRKWYAKVTLENGVIVRVE